jgi:hypothetical protein
MKVRCTRLLNSHRQPVDNSSWLTIGKEYLVLEVSVSETETRFRVISDNAGTPILAWPSEFEAVSDAIPKCWVAAFRPGYLTFSPAAFRVEGFWERYFDGDVAARRQFDETVRVIEEDS